MAGTQDDDKSMPRWVKLTAAFGGALALLAVATMILAGGDHGPGRHAGIAASSETAGNANR